jgi:SAM-dependent methyltransferase
MSERRTRPLERTGTGTEGSPRGVLERAKFWLLDARAGAGRPVPRKHLDAQYRAGYWQHLDSLAELAPCMVIAGYVQHLFAAPRVLDIGCGHGRLCRILAHFGVESYLGVDLSPEAIEQARARPVEGARFEVGDLETWTPAETFDVMVFQDSIYYASQPAAQLLRYSEALTAQGVVVVSMFRYSNNAMIWRRIDRSFRTVEATRIQNEKGEWDVRILRPRDPSHP